MPLVGATPIGTHTVYLLRVVRFNRGRFPNRIEVNRDKWDCNAMTIAVKVLRRTFWPITITILLIGSGLILWSRAEDARTRDTMLIRAVNRLGGQAHRETRYAFDLRSFGMKYYAVQGRISEIYFRRPIRNVPWIGMIMFTDDVDDQAIATLTRVISKSGYCPKLTLVGTSISDVGLSRLSKLPQLTYLDMSGTAITDAGISELALHAGSTIKDLCVSHTSITDKSVSALATMTNLERLDLSHCRLSHQAVLLLRDALPSTRVIHNTLLRHSTPHPRVIE